MSNSERIYDISQLDRYGPALELVYGVRYSTLRPYAASIIKHEDKCHVFGDMERAVFVSMGQDLLGVEEKEQPFLVLDELRDMGPELATIPLPPEVKVVKHGIPIATLRPEDRSFDDWSRAVKVKSSYIRGAKFADLEVLHKGQPVSAEYQWVFDRKRDKFGTHYSYEQHILALMDYCGTDNITATLIGDTVADQLVCLLFSVHDVNRGVLHVPFIHVTDDEVLRRKHMSYVVGHHETVRLGYSLGVQGINFGVYLNFKDPLGLTKVWYSGLRYV